MTRAAFLLEQNWNAVPGGTARSTNSLIDALRQHTAIDISGVTGHHRKPPVLPLPLDLEVSRMPVPGRVLAELWSRMDRPSLDRWVDADVIHAPAYVVPSTKRPLVVTIHDLAFVRHPEWFTPNGVAYFNRFLDRVRDSDMAVVVPSSATADDCVSAGIDGSRVTVVPWGIDPTRADQGAIDEVRRIHALPDRFVLYVGTLEPRKNLATLAEAMIDVADDVPLVIVGPQGWGDVTVRGGRMLGSVDGAQIPALMAAATVLAYPSHFEGFGLPVLEAMAQGTPVITTAGTAPAEVLGEAGLAVDTSIASVLAESIRSLLADHSLQQELGAHGLRRAGMFTWADAALAMSALYEGLR